jgi:hypothetical protein
MKVSPVLYDFPVKYSVRSQMELECGSCLQYTADSLATKRPNWYSSPFRFSVDLVLDAQFISTMPIPTPKLVQFCHKFVCWIL